MQDSTFDTKEEPIAYIVQYPLNLANLSFLTEVTLTDKVTAACQ